jgi:hypothetical protein
MQKTMSEPTILTSKNGMNQILDVQKEEKLHHQCHFSGCKNIEKSIQLQTKITTRIMRNHTFIASLHDSGCRSEGAWEKLKLTRREAVVETSGALDHATEGSAAHPSRRRGEVPSQRRGEVPSRRRGEVPSRRAKELVEVAADGGAPDGEAKPFPDG